MLVSAAVVSMAGNRFGAVLPLAIAATLAILVGATGARLVGAAVLVGGRRTVPRQQVPGECGGQGDGTHGG
jgi:hypothetical protein